MRQNLLEMADAWQWFPPTHEVIKDPEFTLSLNASDPADTVMHAFNTTMPDALVSRVESFIKRKGRNRLKWWVLATSQPQFMHSILTERGYRVSEIVEVLTWDLGDGTKCHLPWPDIPLTNVGRPRDRSEVVDAVNILANVFGTATPSQEELDLAVSSWQKTPETLTVTT
ncbi:MAG: hypothetical protein OWU33_14535 [Firmicutes bacterium]|nr:hypothetical protein [Bacillota bacterium]